jgi:hypothetical protein
MALRDHSSVFDPMVTQLLERGSSNGESRKFQAGCLANRRGALFRGMLLESDKFPESHGEPSVFRSTERVASEAAFQPGYDDRKTGRVKPRI